MNDFNIRIDDKFIEESRQIAMRLSKTILQLDDFIKRHDEALGVLHSMILEIYAKLGLEMPRYQFKTKDPYGCSDEADK